MICVDCRNLWAGPSGVIGYQHNLARELPQVAPRNHFQFLLPSLERERLDTFPNAHAVYLPGNSSSPLRSFSLRMALDLRGVSLVHATGGLFPDVRVPVVTTIHDTLWISDPSSVCPPGVVGHLLGRVYRRLLLRALQWSARLIVPSETARRALEGIAPQAAPRVRVVPHGVGSEFVPLDPNDLPSLRRVHEARQRLVPGAERFVLEVGRAVDHRNHLGLVRAFAAAFRRDPGTHLVFVQPQGARTQAILGTAFELGIDARVHILSGLSSADLCRLYQGALCLCHPTSYESYPTPIAEALACGCPVITSGRAAVGEIANGVAHLVNPERDEEIEAALRRLAVDAAARARLSERGLLRARQFSAADSARATWKIYEEALGIPW